MDISAHTDLNPIPPTSLPIPYEATLMTAFAYVVAQFKARKGVNLLETFFPMVKLEGLVDGKLVMSVSRRKPAYVSGNKCWLELWQQEMPEACIREIVFIDRSRRTPPAPAIIDNGTVVTTLRQKTGAAQPERPANDLQKLTPWQRVKQHYRKVIPQNPAHPDMLEWMSFKQEWKAVVELRLPYDHSGDCFTLDFRVLLDAWKAVCPDTVLISIFTITDVKKWVIQDSDTGAELISVQPPMEQQGEPITLEPPRVRIEDIQRVVANRYNVSKTEMLSNRRTRTIVKPRQVAMYLAKVMTPRSLPEIGRRFGGRDHTTVLHAVRKMERMVQAEAAFRQEMDDIRRIISRPG